MYHFALTIHIWVYVSPQPHSEVYIIKNFQVFENVIGLKWYLTVVLIYISLIMSDIEHLFICLRVIFVFFCELPVYMLCFFLLGYSPFLNFYKLIKLKRLDFCEWYQLSILFSLFVVLLIFPLYFFQANFTLFLCKQIHPRFILWILDFDLYFWDRLD